MIITGPLILAAKTHEWQSRRFFGYLKYSGLGCADNGPLHEEKKPYCMHYERIRSSKLK